MSDTEGASSEVPTPSISKMTELVQGLSVFEKTELIHLLQGAKPKEVKPNVTVAVPNESEQGSGKTEIRNASLSDNSDEGNNANFRDNPSIGRTSMLDEQKIPKLPTFSGDTTSKSQPTFRV